MANMSDMFFIAAAVAMVILLGVLGFGIVNLVFTGEKARSRSNQLMRLRVAVQFVAVLLLLGGLWISQNMPA
jgi:hypothetical protein